ncbi:MAG: molybdenum cofactor guanylyltransferase [Chloroflexota bacterium]|nr:molybdenum cofactor guanylyltransferase [Chloroflexota bacterium]
MNDSRSVSAIVLAGGLSRRLGRDKALEPFGGEPLISRVIGRLATLANETVVVVNSKERATELPLPAGAKTAVDIYPDSGSLGGIFTGLTTASNEWGFVVACDMPFLNTALIKHILSLRQGHDAVVPMLEGYPEPTHSAYSKACLPHIQCRLEAGQLRIARFFDDIRVRYVQDDEVDALDADRLSFFNVNTPDDLAHALSLVEEGR